MDNSKKIFVTAFLLSLFFHALIFLIFLFSDFSLFANTVEPEPDKKIRVQLQKPKPVIPPQALQQEAQPQIPESFNRLVENPNANETDPDYTSLLSDKSSVSAAPQAGDRNEISSIPSAEKNAGTIDNNITKDDFFEGLKLPYKTFSKGHLTSRLPEASQKQQQKKDDETGNDAPSLPDASPDAKTKVFDPKEVGAFSLNTYAWEYAPYMTSWLRYLQQHWTAPAAYTRLGLIHGTTYVRFRIFPDGHMEAFEVLQHEGHKSLRLSSTNAVEASFPYKPLPEDFPEEYLEITLQMLYPDLRKFAR